MKKIVSVTFIFLAMFFCTKDLLVFSFLWSEPTSCILDACEKDAKEQNENDTPDEDDTEEWEQELFGRMTLNNTRKIRFFNHKENGSFMPYSEIHSPPPDLS